MIRLDVRCIFLLLLWDTVMNMEMIFFGVGKSRFCKSLAKQFCLLIVRSGIVGISGRDGN